MKASSEIQFNFPYKFDARLARDYRVSDALTTIALNSVSRTPANPQPSPYELYVGYTQSPLGIHHERQDVRYPNFNRDLPDSLIPEHRQTDEQRDAFRQLMITSLLPSRLSTVGQLHTGQALDLHPTAHGTLVATKFNDLIVNSPLSQVELSPEWIQTERYLLPRHDNGENTHKQIREVFGDVVGDIPMAVGKTPEQRVLERDIFAYSLQQELSGVLPQSTLDAMVALAAHDLASLPKEAIPVYAAGELGHHENALATAFFARRSVGKILRRNNSVDNLYLAGNMMALVEQAQRQLTTKFDKVLDLDPQVRLALGSHVSKQLVKLDIAIHSLDDHPDLLKWRMSDAATAHYGEYIPKAA